MEKIIALFGWKYVKDCTTNKYHHYKCQEINGIVNREIYNKEGMKEDLARHPYTLAIDNCLEQIM